MISIPKLHGQIFNGAKLVRYIKVIHQVPTRPILYLAVLLLALIEVPTLRRSMFPGPELNNFNGPHPVKVLVDSAGARPGRHG